MLQHFLPRHAIIQPNRQIQPNDIATQGYRLHECRIYLLYCIVLKIKTVNQIPSGGLEWMFQA